MRRDVTPLLISGMLAMAVAIGLGRFAFTPLLPLMKADVGFGPVAAGWLGSANHVGYLVGAIWAAMVHRTAAKHRLILAGLIAGQLSLGAMAFTTDLWLWAALRFVSGLASAWVFVLASALVVATLAAQGKARLAGWHFGGIGLGIVLAGGLIGAVGDKIGWTGGWLLVAALGGVASLFAWPRLSTIEMPPPPQAAQAAGAPAMPMLLLAFSYFCEGLGYIVTGTFLVTVAKQEPLLAGVADLAWVGVGVMVLPSAVFWSSMAERLGYRRTLVSAHLIQGVGIGLPALVAHPAAIIVSALLYGATFVGIVGVALAYGRSLGGVRPARTMGLLTVAFGVGQIVGPAAAGAIAEQGGWNPALLFAAGVVLAGIPPLLVPKRSVKPCPT